MKFIKALFKLCYKIIRTKFFWQTLFVATIILTGYLFYLNNVIVGRFTDRRWNLPSRVYSDSFTIYSGQNLSLTEIQSRLHHLGYRQINTQPKHHGTYHIENDQIQIYLHSFEYPHETFPGQAISFKINSGRVFSLADLKSKKSLPLIKLEPERISSVFDDKMEDRTFVSLDQIPRVLTEGVVLIEDERFYSHFGIDPIGILRAMVKNIFSGRIVQGGSTLTQQMVKNFFLTHERTLIRKVNEILMALIIDARYSKEEILEVYLNEIYFGQKGSASVTGVQEASHFYFSKDVSQLLPEEAALIAAIIRAPGLYSPYNNPKNATGRRNLILKRLYEHKTIGKKQYQQGLKAKLPKSSKIASPPRSSHFIDFVKKQIIENYPSDILESQGLRIFTTLDMHFQRAAEKAVAETLNQLETQRPFLKKNSAKNMKLEGALISLNPKTGFVRAYVGGRNYSQSQYDIISQAHRQPGSTFKPFVYLTALDPHLNEAPFTLASLIDDNDIKINTGAGPWRPQNYDHKYHGQVRLRTALEKSYNVATAWLGQQIGLNNVVETARMAGMGDNLKAFPSLVLGAFEVTPLELATAYTVFPNNGSRALPVAIRRVVTKENEVLDKKSFTIKKVFEPDVIYLMNKAMQGVIDHGTAASARSNGFNKRAAGKTGTTSGYKDAWFAGYTTELLTVVWVGYKENTTTNLSGASGALPIWTEYMKVATESESNLDFTPADNIVIVPIDKATGLLYHRKCDSEIDEYFIEGTEPRTRCDQISKD